MTAAATWEHSLWPLTRKYLTVTLASLLEDRLQISVACRRWPTHRSLPSSGDVRHPLDFYIEVGVHSKKISLKDRWLRVKGWEHPINVFNKNLSRAPIILCTQLTMNTGCTGVHMVFQNFYNGVFDTVVCMWLFCCGRWHPNWTRAPNRSSVLVFRDNCGVYAVK